ncbi:hypothetical protein GCM10009647_069540 [Streptomyces sanglieri]
MSTPANRGFRVSREEVIDLAGGSGWPVANRLARATAVTRRVSEGKTVTARLARQHDRSRGRDDS